MAIIAVPVSKLVLSEQYQARKTRGPMSLETLAASIHAHGLIHNLTAVKAKKRGYYEVVAGGRRLQAIQLLVADGRWSADQTVPVQVSENEHVHALELSLAENLNREAMHPADEFEAFHALQESGASVEDIAARFGVTPIYVLRRLKLARVAPALIQAYREGAMSLEMLMAFTVSEDHERQLNVWQNLAAWQRSPHHVRQLLTHKSWTAKHALARFVGLDAYRAAGGRTYQDLFADSDLDGVYLQDSDLLISLAQEKLQRAADDAGEGWAWVETALSLPEASWADYSTKYGRVEAEPRALSEDEAARIAELTEEINVLTARLAEIEESEDEATVEELQAQIEARDLCRAEIEEAAKQWPDELKRVAGVGIYVTYDGKLSITYGLIRPTDRQEACKVLKSFSEAKEATVRASLPAPVTRPRHSERLVRQLTAHKVGIVAADLAQKPEIALAVLVAHLAVKVLGQPWNDFALGVSLTEEPLRSHAPDFEGSHAHQTLASLERRWREVLPVDDLGRVTRDVLPWAMQQDHATLVELLAYLTARSVQGVQYQEQTTDTPLDVLARVAGTDIAAWWQPTAESYFKHVSKEVVVQAVTDGVGAERAAPLLKMKKGEAAAEAETLLAGTRWLPTPLRVFEVQPHADE